jgi:hypothetical protein
MLLQDPAQPDASEMLDVRSHNASIVTGASFGVGKLLYDDDTERFFFNRIIDELYFNGRRRISEETYTSLVLERSKEFWFAVSFFGAGFSGPFLGENAPDKLYEQLLKNILPFMPDLIALSNQRRVDNLLANGNWMYDWGIRLFGLLKYTNKYTEERQSLYAAEEDPHRALEMLARWLESLPVQGE